MRRVRAAASFPSQRSFNTVLFSCTLSSAHDETFRRAALNTTDIIWTSFYTYLYVFLFFIFILGGLFPFLSTHLHAGLGEIDFQRHLFAHEYVRVASFGKQRLQNVELCARKSSPLSSLLPRRRCG